MESRVHRLLPTFLRVPAGVLFALFALIPPAFSSGPQLSILTYSILGADHNGIIDANECNTLQVTVRNTGNAPATNVTGALWRADDSLPVIPIPQGNSTFPTIQAGGSATNYVPFEFRTTQYFVCGTTVPLVLTIVCNEGVFDIPVNLPSGIQANSNFVFSSSFSTPPTPLLIPDGGAVDSPIDVNYTHPYSKVSVSVYITHPHVSDLKLSLLTPLGTTITLANHRGGAGSDYGSTCFPYTGMATFDDDATASIAIGTAPFVGNFRPESSLAGLKAFTVPPPLQSARWKLHVEDNSAGSTGTLQCWNMNVFPYQYIFRQGCPPALKTRQDDGFTTDIRSTDNSTGWGPLGEGRFPADSGAETDNGWSGDHALLAVSHPRSASPAHYRITGWQSQKSEWIPFSSIGSNNFIRTKFYVTTSGIQNQNDLNQIPNLRFRVAARFAQTAMLEVQHQQTLEDPGNGVSQDLRPSVSPPFNIESLYRVDYAPVWVPALLNAGEGVLRGFENYSLDPEDNGTVMLRECTVGQYPASLVPNSTTPVKFYQPSASDAGSLKAFAATDDSRDSIILPANVGEFATPDTTAQSTITDSSSGVTFDTSAVNKQPSAGVIRAAIAKREFYPGSDLTQRVRVEADKLYKIRYHITSTQYCNRMPLIRPRVRTIKFAYTQKFEIGGALNTGGGNQSAGNNLIALQSLPGLGGQNPDKNSTENGGWYTILMNTPISTDLNLQNPAQPLINLQPGPGSNSASVRDLRCAFEMIDSVDTNAAALQWERGNAKVDKIEVRTFPQVSD